MTAHLPSPEDAAASRVETWGPYPLPKGTITGQNKQQILRETWCTVINRGEKGVGTRTFSVKGDIRWLPQAYRMALNFIDQNGKEGGRQTAEERQEQLEQQQASTSSCLPAQNPV